MGASLAAVAGFVLVVAARASADIEGVTAVASKVSSDYIRPKLPDGTLQPEFYAFGEGGKWEGEISDGTIDKLGFPEVARAIAGPLAAQKYLPATEAAKTRLLIMVYWGTTSVPGPASDSAALDQYQAAQANMNKYLVRSASDPRQKVPGGGPLGDAALSQLSAATVMLDMENRLNDRIDFMNASLLGYDSPGLIGTSKGNYVRGTALGTERDDLYAEIEENRYFVVLMAYDFQLMWREKKHKLLWETRFSISERRNAFDKALPVMAQYASPYFGRPSNGLLRTRVPEGRVEIGETKSLGEVEAPLK